MTQLPFLRTLLRTLFAATLPALALPSAVMAQTQCTLSDATLVQVFPMNKRPLREGGSQAIIGVSFPTTCPARIKPLMVCLDLWDTTACPSDAPPGTCDGLIRGSIGLLATGGWVRVGGPTICNTEFLTEPDGLPIRHQLNFLFGIQNDNVKADRQNYLIVHMHNPFQVLRIPIVDDD